MVTALKHLDYCTIVGPQGEGYRGADQEWYQEDWQRRAGCGPTTASLCLAYLSRTHGQWEKLSPKTPLFVETFLPYMEEVWGFVTPGPRGLDTLEAFGRGCTQFAQSRGCALGWTALGVPGRGEPDRPSPSQCAAFLRTALERDTPVGFLNYSNGAVDILDSWHWVPLIALKEAEALTCTILDAGKEMDIDLGLWLATTSRGGGFVALLST